MRADELEKILKAQSEQISQQFSELVKGLIGNNPRVEDSSEKQSSELYWKLQSLVGEFNADIERGVTFESWYSFRYLLSVGKYNFILKRCFIISFCCCHEFIDLYLLTCLVDLYLV